MKKKVRINLYLMKKEREASRLRRGRGRKGRRHRFSGCDSWKDSVRKKLFPLWGALRKGGKRAKNLLDDEHTSSLWGREENCTFVPF